MTSRPAIASARATARPTTPAPTTTQSADSYATARTVAATRESEWFLVCSKPLPVSSSGIGHRRVRVVGEQRPPPTLRSHARARWHLQTSKSLDPTLLPAGNGLRPERADGVLDGIADDAGTSDDEDVRGIEAAQLRGHARGQ